MSSSATDDPDQFLREFLAAATAQQRHTFVRRADYDRGEHLVRAVLDDPTTDRATALSAYRAGLDVAKASAFVVPVAGLAMNVSLLVVLGVGGLRVATGAVSVASLVTFAMFLFLMIMPLGSAFGALSSVGQALGAL